MEPSELIEAQARVETLLQAAGWSAGGDAGARYVVEYQPGVDRLVLDYALFLDDRLVAAVEVHSGMSEAVEHYAPRLARTLADSGLFPGDRLPVVYFSNGRETVVLPGPDKDLREVTTFHSPDALARPSSLTGLAREIAELPAELPSKLRDAQFEAIRALEASLARGDRRALVALPQGFGRSAVVFAVTERLHGHTSARRFLVLVDRNAVAEQMAAGMRDWIAGEAALGSDFTVGLPQSGRVSGATSFVVMTVQRAESMLEGDPLPVDHFDFLWALDPERLTGTRWQRALDYFDAPLVGLTNSPTPETGAYFDGNLVARFDASQLLADYSARPDADALSRLYDWTNRFRGELLPEDALLRALREGDFALGWRELTAVTQRLGKRGVLSPEPFVLEFLAAYLAGRGAEWAVDPAVATPALLAAVMEAGAAKRAVGFAPNRFVLELAEGLRTDPDISWTEEDLLGGDAHAATALRGPSLIVSAPPFGVKGGSAEVRLPDGRTLEVRDDAGYRLLLQTAAGLDEDGEAVFLVADGFFRAGPGRVRSLLADAGLHVHAVIAVRQGFNLSVASSLVFIRREPTDSVFVAELSPDIDRTQLVSLLKRRRRGPVPALGRFVAWEGFKGFTQVAAGERLEMLLAESLGESTPLAELLDGSIIRPKKNEDFESVANAVYLPTFAASPVHAGRVQLTSKPWGYYQLPLDPEKALAEYVAALFNNPVGRALRESVSSGGAHPSIPRRALDELQLPLPDIAVQRRAVAARARVRALRLELDGLERQLASDPTRAQAVEDALDGLDERDPLTTFRESLPFPLASILWRYEADADPKDKVAHLHGFFEATAIYFVTVLLSAFMRDDELYRNEKKEWFKKLRRNSFNRSNLGTWTLFGHKMASSVRQLLDDPDEKDRMLRAFAVDSERFVNAAANSELWDLLDEAKEVRNKEKGHPGFAGPVQHEETHARLVPLLTQLGELLGPCLDDVMLVRPGAGRHRRGVTYYDRAERLQGPPNTFKQIPVSTTENPALEDAELYLMSTTGQPTAAALRLEPFVRLKHPPPSAQNACYFYAELQADGVEFVSHHFEDRPRITEPDEDVVQLIETLQARDDANGD